MATRSTDAARNEAGQDWTEPGLLTSVLNDRQVPGTGSSRWRYFFSGVWLAYLIQPVSDLFHHHGAAWIAGGIIITIAFCAIYLPTLFLCESRPRLALYGLGTLAVLAAVACLVYGKNWTPLWIYVSAAAGFVLTSAFGSRRASFGIFAIRMQIGLMHELDQARGTVAKLATNEERLRLARDMHDLTGQSLSMITLKSELAAKRLAKLPSSAERDSVLTELGDIGRVSRQTLHDIREAVSGYRRPTLAIEVITARNALEAAGIALEDDAGLTLRSGTFDPEAEAVLAWCLREAVTNVIRHSGARHCRIRLTERMDEVSLEVTDDGRGFPGQNPENPATPDSAHGSGLRGVSERLSAIGGRLSLGPADGSGPKGPGHGFRLIATVPTSGQL
jgi:two-component system sensor histidine kinase DesK